jgi:hypothetical protein
MLEYKQRWQHTKEFTDGANNTIWLFDYLIMLFPP